MRRGNTLNLLFGNFYAVSIQFLSLHVFDTKLDHPDANVINCIYERVNLNPRGRNHVKHSCEHLFFVLL